MMLARVQKIRALALAIVSTMTVGAATDGAAEQRGDCGRQGTTVIYDDPVELDVACQALADIIVYFDGIGFVFVPNVTLSFRESPSAPASSHFLSHGHFDARNGKIVIHRDSGAKPWGMPWSVELAASFLRHELVHAAIWQIVGHIGTRLTREWHEFIAYAVQLALLDERLRDRILARHALVRPVRDLLEVNEFTYGMDPEAFGVLAYKTSRERGGASFVGQLLRAGIIPPALSHPFPHPQE